MPNIASTLQSRGHKIRTKTLGNYMRAEGIKAIWVRPYVRTTIDPDFYNKLKNILNRDFRPPVANAVWVTDITYIHTVIGFVYLTSVIDLYSRKIIGWELSDSLSTEHVLKALEKAKKNRKISHSVVIHSDRGCQYVSKNYIEATPAANFDRSYSRKGNPWDYTEYLEMPKLESICL